METTHWWDEYITAAGKAGVPTRTIVKLEPRPWWPEKRKEASVYRLNRITGIMRAINLAIEADIPLTLTTDEVKELLSWLK